jgi:hypothetical protein
VRYDLIVLCSAAIAVYMLVLLAHSLRHRAGTAYYYGLLGGLTAIMSWVTDSGVSVEFAGITFMVGSVVFYTSLLLGVFVVYAFDGPAATRKAIAIVAAVSTLAPLISVFLHFLADLSGTAAASLIPSPGLRVNTASVLVTVVDLLFLGIAWEILGRERLRMRLWMRTFVVLLGVMWLDVVLFSTGAFAGSPQYLSILQGSLLSRFVISALAWPLLYAYMDWQSRVVDSAIENRPVLAILREMAEVRAELGSARREIERRRKLERENEALIQRLRGALNRVNHLEGLLPVCAECRRIRVEDSDTGGGPRWMSLEEYVETSPSISLSHGICADCARKLYPEYGDKESDSP